MLTLLGYIGTVCIIAGIWGVGRKYRHALLFSMVGEAAYMVRELAKWPDVDWALLSLVAILLVVAADGWRRWQQDSASQGGGHSTKMAERYARWKAGLDAL